MKPDIEMAVHWDNKPITISPPDAAMVDEVAFRMCAGLGLNPLEQCTYPASDSVDGGDPLMPSQRLSIGISMNGTSTGNAVSQEFLTAPYMASGPRWKSYRRRAAEAIVGWHAVHATIMGG